MEEKILQEVLRQAPFGYAYHKLVYNAEGLPEDYIFLDVNPAFEEMTGLKREAILGKKVTEVLQGIKNSGFDWVDFYGKAVLCGERREFTQYAESLGRWYKVTSFSPQKEHFVTIFQEITLEMERIKTLEEQEQRIRELTTELETVFNGTQDAMFLVKVENGEFRYIRNNAVHQELTGYSMEDIKDKTPLEAAGAEIGTMVKAGYQRCVEAKVPITYEETLPFPAGERTWLTALTPVLENGKVKYLVGSRKDITLQKKAEKEREELLHRLQAMFNGHTAVMLLIEPKSGRIVDANPAACAFYGYTREEILSMCIQDINMLPKEEVEKCRLLAFKEKQRYFVFPHRLKSGEIRLVDVYSCPITHSREKLLFSIIFDVTDREKYKEELYREKELLRTTLLSIGDGVVTTDQAGKIMALNRAAEEITGWSEEEAKGSPFAQVFKLISEDTGKKVEDPVAKVLETGKIIGLANHTALIAKDGRKIPIADSAAPIKDEKGQTFGVVMVFRDVTQEKAWQEKILYLSYHDSLTGLYNRRFMEEQIKRLEKSWELPISVIMADVNGLKLANDVFGHEEGDKLLIKAAEVLKESCRKEDIIARWGGDEFLIVLPRTSAKTAEEIIERIKNRCLRVSDGKVQLSIAMGYAVKTQDSESLKETLKEAEKWMYRRKLMEGKSYRSAIINTLLATLFAKSAETEEHAERLKIYCLTIGREMRLSAKELDELVLLAVLHDIGKVGIKENVLQKPGPLTAEDWEEMKKHPEIGCRIAQNTPELAPVAEYILCHHERWDGQGYPQGLKGEEIPLLCRILAVADAYDAMTSDRTYRKAMSREEAIAEIKRNAGTQFEPEIVEFFLEGIKKITEIKGDEENGIY
jgi:diguanylate cyclase (GGDEF)-like protein/PAS domain S-box-containing protein